MTESINVPEDESKKDTVRINLPPTTAGRTPIPPAKHDTARVSTTDQAKKETSLLGTPTSADDFQAKNQTMLMGSLISSSEAKKETSRVAVPSSKPTVPEMPRPTVRLRREGGLDVPSTSSSVPSTKPPVPEMPRPTVKLKVEEQVSTATGPSLTSPIVVSSAAAAPSMVDMGLSITAALISLVAVIYLAKVALS